MAVPAPVSVPLPSAISPLRRSARLGLVVHPSCSPPLVDNRKRQRGGAESASHLPVQPSSSPRELRSAKRRRVEALALPTRKRKPSEPSGASLSHLDKEPSLPKRRKENSCAVASNKAKSRTKPSGATAECSNRSLRSRRSSFVGASEPKTRTKRFRPTIPVIPVTNTKVKEKASPARGATTVVTPTAPTTRGCTPEKAVHQRRSARVSGRSAEIGALRCTPKPLSQGSKSWSSSVEEASEPSPLPGRVASPTPYSAHIVVIAMTSPPKSDVREGSCKSVCAEDRLCAQSMAHIVTFDSKDHNPETPSSPTVTELAPSDSPLVLLPPATSTISPTLPTLEPSSPSSNTNTNPPFLTSDLLESGLGAHIRPIDLPKLIVIRPTPPSSCSSPSPPSDDLPCQIYDSMGIKVLVTPPSRESSPPQLQSPVTDIDPVPTPSLSIEGPRVIEIPEYIPAPAPVPATMSMPVIDVGSSETQPVLENMDYMQYDHQRDMMGIPGPGPTTMMWRQQQQQGFTLQQQDQQGQGEGAIQLQQPYTYSYDYEYANGLSFSSDGHSPVLPSSPEQQPYAVPLEPRQGQRDSPMEDLTAGTGYESGEDDGTVRKRRWLPGKRRTLGMWEIACQFRVSELIRRYTFPAIRDIVTHQMETYSIRHGKPKSWYLEGEQFVNLEIDTEADVEMADKGGARKENENVNGSGCGARGGKTGEEREDWSDYESELSDSDDEENTISGQDGKRRRTWPDEEDDDDEEDEDEDAEGEIDPDAWHDPSFQVQQQDVQGGGRMIEFYAGPVGCVDEDRTSPPKTPTPALEQSASTGVSITPCPIQPTVPAQIESQRESEPRPFVASSCPDTTDQTFDMRPIVIQPSPLASLTSFPSPSPSPCTSCAFPTSPITESTLPVPPPRLNTIRALSLRAIEIGVAREVTRRGTPIDRARAAQWAHAGSVAVAGSQAVSRNGPGDWEQRGRSMERGRGRTRGVRRENGAGLGAPLPGPIDDGFHDELAAWDAFLDRLEREDVGGGVSGENQVPATRAARESASHITPMEVEFGATATATVADVNSATCPPQGTRSPDENGFYLEQPADVASSPAPPLPSPSLVSRPPPDACWWLPTWAPSQPELVGEPLQVPQGEAGMGSVGGVSMMSMGEEVPVQMHGV